MRVGRHSIEISSEDKVFFPDSGLTKGDLIDYYRKIAEYILPHVKDRPLTMHRFPDGIGKKGFYHKDIPDYFPDWIERKRIKKKGGTYTQVLANNAATLVYLANQGSVTPHIWLSKVEKLSRPDRIVFDLDPSDNSFAKVRKAATICLDLFDEIGLSVFIQTTGSRGIHLVMPIKPKEDFDTVRIFARSCAALLAREHPTLMTIEQRKDKRGKRVFLDINRNAYGQTAVAPYSVRARKGAPIATPIDRDELDNSSLKPDKYTIENIFRRLGRKDDPWVDINRKARSLAKPRRKLDRL
jgi:bifunctional non-homologous end joining protein LigD